MLAIAARTTAPIGHSEPCPCRAPVKDFETALGWKQEIKKIQSDSLRSTSHQCIENQVDREVKELPVTLMSQFVGGGIGTSEKEQIKHQLNYFARI